MEGSFLTDDPRCGLCIHWIGSRCTNPMRHPSYVDSIDNCCVLFTPFHHAGTISLKKDFIKTVDTVHEDSLVGKPNYKEDKPTYESGYLLSKFGKL